ncbi:hypothetical protein AB9E23_05490 [Rhizobium leguminosarum]|jgi:hypothetical protein
MLKHQAMQPPVSRAGGEKRLWPEPAARRRVLIDALIAASELSEFSL